MSYKVTDKRDDDFDDDDDFDVDSADDRNNSVDARRLNRSFRQALIAIVNLLSDK